MDKQKVTLVSAVVVIVIIIALIFYLVTANSNSSKEIERLKTDLQIVAKYQDNTNNQQNDKLEDLAERTFELESNPKFNHNNHKSTLIYNNKSLQCNNKY